MTQLRADQSDSVRLDPARHRNAALRPSCSQDRIVLLSSWSDASSSRSKSPFNTNSEIVLGRFASGQSVPAELRLADRSSCDAHDTIFDTDSRWVPGWDERHLTFDELRVRATRSRPGKPRRTHGTERDGVTDLSGSCLVTEVVIPTHFAVLTSVPRRRSLSTRDLRG